MSDSTTLTLRLPAELKERLGALALRTNRTHPFLAGEAPAGHVDGELAIIDGIRQRRDDVAAGRTVPHDEAMWRVREGA